MTVRRNLYSRPQCRQQIHMGWHNKFPDADHRRLTFFSADGVNESCMRLTSTSASRTTWIHAFYCYPYLFTKCSGVSGVSKNRPNSQRTKKKELQRKLLNATTRHSKSNKQTTRKHTYWITRLCEGIANSHTYSCGLWARCDAFTRISLYLLLICLNCTCCVIVAIFDPTHAHKSKTDLCVCVYATSARIESTERAYTHNNHFST